MWEDNREVRIACVWLPHFLWQLEAGEQADAEDTPAIIIGKSPHASGGDMAVLDHSSGLSGIEVGMPMSHAKGLHRRARFIEVDELQAEGAFHAVALSLQDVTPEVEPGEFGVVYVNLSGSERLYGSDRGSVLAIARAVESQPFQDVRIGIGPNKWLAYVIATKSAPRKALKLSGSPADFLDPLPIAHLPISFGLKERLRQFGLTKLRDIAGLPLGPFQAQFGPEGKLAWELANGIDNRPFLPVKAEERITRSTEIDPPTIMLPTVLVTLESLTAQAFSDRSRKGRHIRAAQVILKCSDRGVMRIKAIFHTPVGSTAQVMKVVEPKVIATAFESPVEMAQVSLCGLTSETARQISLLPDVRQQAALKDTLTQIRVAVGAEVYWIRDTDQWSPLPEERAILVPANL